jgi:hypothetical protein
MTQQTINGTVYRVGQVLNNYTEVDNGFAWVTQFEYSDCPVCWQQVMEEAA